MDTDGSATEHYCTFATISEKLASDVCELVHSLGGYASVNKRKAGYKKNNQYVKCNDYFELVIEFTKGTDEIFCLSRKKDKYNMNKMLQYYIAVLQLNNHIIPHPQHLYL